MFESSLILLLWVATTYIVANLVLGILEAFKQPTVVLEKKLHAKLDEIIHRVKEEKHGDMIYWFDLDDGEFLAQGLTQDSIIAVLKERFPQHIFFLPTDHYVGFPKWTLTEIPFESLNKSQ